MKGRKPEGTASKAENDKSNATHSRVVPTPNPISRSCFPKTRTVGKNVPEMSDDSKTFCILPWVHMKFRANGDVFPCCASRFDLPIGSLKRMSLLEAWNSGPLRLIRQNMLKGVENIACKKCYRLERSGQESMRQFYNRTMAERLALVRRSGRKVSLEPSEISFLEVEDSNICNQKCRYCSRDASTAWYADYTQFRHLPEQTITLRPTEAPEDLIREIEEVLPSLKEIRFTGGEPLISDGHHDIVKLLVKQNRFDVRLSYSTNFSSLSYKDTDFAEVWPKFESVFVSASLDGMGRRGEYIRKNQDWEKVESNRQRMLQKCPDVVFAVGPTLTAMNVLHVPDFHREWIRRGYVKVGGSFHLNVLTEPEEFSVQILPTDLKKQVTEKYERHIAWLKKEYREVAAPEIGHYQRMTDFVTRSDETHLLKKFRETTAALDALWGDRFEDVFPELAALMKGEDVR